MGMTENQKALIRAIAENKISECKKYALNCCIEDKTAKNELFVKRYKPILENRDCDIEIPYNLKGMVIMEDASKSFREDRYYLTDREKNMYEQIVKMNDASLKLMELGIPYINSTLLTGSSGTGKTTFGRYIAFKLGLPFVYINFSYLIDSYMGNTSKNISNVFNFVKMNKCVLMLDEIDCIAQVRQAADSGSSREFSNTTVTLLQELDNISNDTIIIGATNIPSIIDHAVLRRFNVIHEIKSLTKEEVRNMIKQYMDTIPYSYDATEISYAVDALYSKEFNSQAKIITYIVKKIADCIIKEEERISLIV